MQCTASARQLLEPSTTGDVSMASSPLATWPTLASICCTCVWKRERERETETKKERERERKRKREREREREKEKERERRTHARTKRSRERERRQRKTETHKQTTATEETTEKERRCAHCRAPSAQRPHAQKECTYAPRTRAPVQAETAAVCSHASRGKVRASRGPAAGGAASCDSHGAHGRVHRQALQGQGPQRVPRAARLRGRGRRHRPRRVHCPPQPQAPGRRRQQPGCDARRWAACTPPSARGPCSDTAGAQTEPPSAAVHAAVFVALTCAFVYERYDFDLEIFENVLYERSAQVYPASSDVVRVRPAAAFELPGVRVGRRCGHRAHPCRVSARCRLGVPPASRAHTSPSSRSRCRTSTTSLTSSVCRSVCRRPSRSTRALCTMAAPSA